MLSSHTFICAKFYFFFEVGVCWGSVGHSLGFFFFFFFFFFGRKQFNQQESTMPQRRPRRQRQPRSGTNTNEPRVDSDIPLHAVYYLKALKEHSSSPGSNVKIDTLGTVACLDYKKMKLEGRRDELVEKRGFISLLKAAAMQVCGGQLPTVKYRKHAKTPQLMTDLRMTVRELNNVITLCRTIFDAEGRVPTREELLQRVPALGRTPAGKRIYICIYSGGFACAQA